MYLRVFYCFLIKKIQIVNAFNRKTTFITFFRSHCISNYMNTLQYSSPTQIFLSS